MLGRVRLRGLFLASLGLLFWGLVGCTGIPDKVNPVTEFDLPKYLGTWHEIARLDHSFERGLTQVTANYSMRDDGGVKVVNRGFNEAKAEWQEAVGKAYFIDSPDIGRLKVSFFGPFYGAYNIAMIDKDYSMALIIGPNLDYGWILARDSEPAAAQCDKYLAEAKRIGIELDSWIWVGSCNSTLEDDF